MKSKTGFLQGIVLFLLFFSPLLWAKEQQIWCQVVGVSDGDTLTCLHQKRPFKVRLIHIDAPELAQPFGQRAKQALSALAYRQEVRLQVQRYDKYQRLLAVVYNKQGKNLNLQLVKQGMAWAYYQSQPEYVKAQQRAQASRIGLWQDSQPIEPYQWRKSRH